MAAKLKKTAIRTTKVATGGAILMTGASPNNGAILMSKPK